MVGTDSGGSDRGERAESERVAASSASGAGDPDLDEFLRVVSDRRRRCALYSLASGDPQTVDALATHVAARLERTSPDAVSESQRDAVRVMLVHADIPRLEETGVVSYDRRTETLRLDYPPARIETLLETCDGLEE
ncbi:DUF7344 domain-containing protein [Natrinema salaciae]|uniref:DUF7344 domain-containing protein n=1 Tax=Natrinema salaciae TaxID=1186196 RepID=A0A1H9M4E9_9EURY|nr:hypothetical protein [Natrinema salaciae]SER18580.1 hypothetical protein SAMN04489841_3202 [Natrinema salaciae]